MRHTKTFTFIRHTQPAGGRRSPRARAGGLRPSAPLLALLVAGLLLALVGVAALGTWGTSGRVAHAGPLTAPGLSTGSGDSAGKSSGLPTPTSNTGGEAGKAKSPTPTVAANATPNMTPISEAGLVGWERDALRDLAEVLNWPNTVTYD